MKNLVLEDAATGEYISTLKSLDGSPAEFADDAAAQYQIDCFEKTRNPWDSVRTRWVIVPAEIEL